jgi:hypothetical protein
MNGEIERQTEFPGQAIDIDSVPLQMVDVEAPHAAGRN